MMRWSSELRAYLRFALGLRSFLDERETLESAKARIARNLARREAHFLTLLEQSVFGHPSSPYLPLFNHADIGLEDVRRLLAESGLERALAVLSDAGVFVTFEEFKGRQPIVRNGREYVVRSGDFDNPLRRGWMRVETSGSSGQPTRVIHDLDFLQERVAHFVVGLASHGVLGAPTALWRGVLPDGSGLNLALILGRAGQPPLRWFTPTWHGRWQDRRLLKFRIAHSTVKLVSKVGGLPIPSPELVDVNDADEVARWMAGTVRQHGRCATLMVVSGAVRVARAAIGEGIDLTGATFVIAGEPATAAKISVIRQSGAAIMTSYGQIEVGRIGMGCCDASDASDVHVLSDICAVTSSPRRIKGPTELHSALTLTVVIPAAPKVLINTELDDCAIFESRRCSCPLGELGLTMHLRDIRSYGKLTDEGVTVLESEWTHVLEDVLPRHFGGSAIDYQLLEEEDEAGLSRITLIVDPGIPIASDADIVRVALEALGQRSLGAEAARQVWSRTGTLRVRRMRPVATGQGKMESIGRARS